MSQRLIQPGLAALTHPRTGLPITPLGYRRNGAPIWPVIGGSGEDDPPEGLGDDNDSDDDSGDDEDEDDQDDEDEDSGRPKKSRGKHRKDEDEDEDGQEDKPVYTQFEYDRLKKRMRAADKRSSDLEDRLKKLENKGKKPEQVREEEDREAQEKADRAQQEANKLRLENAFLRANTIDWVDADDALVMAERLGLLEDVIEDDGKVDRKALARALKELARRKPHLVKPARGQGEKDDDEDDEDQRSGPPRISARKKRRDSSDRESLAKAFPALRRN